MKKAFLAAAVAVLIFTGCSEQTQQQVENTAQTVASQTEKNMKKAAEKTEEVTANAELTASIKSALIASKQVDTSNIDVDSQDGVVFLRGSVKDETQKELAEKIAKNTAPEGATVKNELAVSVGAADDEGQEKVEESDK